MSQRRRLLALATNPETGASTRFRVLQWAPRLEQAGFLLSLDAFYPPEASTVLYQPGRRMSKAAYLLSGSIRRAMSLARAARTADALLIHREAFPLGRKLWFRMLERFPGPILYDYDDAMFLPQRQGRGLLAWLEDLETPREVMALSDVVFAGNEFLAGYARRHARRVLVLPTCIDTERFRPRSDASERRGGPRLADGQGRGGSSPDTSQASDRLLTVGWIGSHSTAKYLQSLAPALERTAARRRFRLYVVGTPFPPRLGGVEVEAAPWVLEREVEDFARCDIGIYPLWDDPWAQGKCGFKALQFMACGVPVVAASVGVNREIIQDGVNGLLASTEEDWVERLGRLLSDEGLRARLGQAGRATVERSYSLAAHEPTLIGALRDAFDGAHTQINT